MRSIAALACAEFGQQRRQGFAGRAWWFEYFAPGDGVLQTLEAAARAGGKGLWGDPAAVAPWDGAQVTAAREVVG